MGRIAQQESQLRSFQQEHPILVYGAAFLIYVVVTGLSLPGATVLTLVYGWYFGLLEGIVLVSFASTAGAMAAFLLSRFLFRDTIQVRFGERLAGFNQALEKEGPFFLFTLLGVFPLLVRYTLKLATRPRSQSESGGCGGSRSSCCNSNGKVKA